MFEVILQIFGEILLQAFFELLVELGLHSLGDTLRKPKRPLFSTVGFILWGLIAGGISLLIFPTSHIVNSDLRLLNLIITPVMLGLMMMFIGKIRNRRGQALVRLDRFFYAFIFAFTMALVRFFGAV